MSTSAIWILQKRYIGCMLIHSGLTIYLILPFYIDLKLTLTILNLFGKQKFQCNLFALTRKLINSKGVISEDLKFCEIFYFNFSQTSACKSTFPFCLDFDCAIMTNDKFWQIMLRCRGTFKLQHSCTIIKFASIAFGCY